MINRKELMDFLDTVNYKMVFMILFGYLILSGIIIGIFDGKVAGGRSTGRGTATPTDATEEMTTEASTQEATTEAPTPVTGYDLSEAEKSQDHLLLLQTDPRWVDAPYGQTGTVGEHGSGPTALSMAVIDLTGNYEATPPRVAEFSAEKGYYMDQQGTSYNLITEGCANYGLKCEWLGADEAKFKYDIDNGGVIITSINADTFGDGQDVHYVVIYGYDSDGFLINDPLSSENSSKSWKYEDLKKNFKGIFSMSVDSNATTEAPAETTTEADTTSAEG